MFSLKLHANVARPTQTLAACIVQVDGCGLDLSTAKTYLQRHRTCQEHLRSLECIVGGVPSR
jgi:hypothetical protein